MSLSQQCNNAWADAFILSMTTHSCTPRLLTLMAATVFTVCRADEEAKPATETDLRATITKGLSFLATAGDQWMEDKSCNSCHHMPLLIWGHREAKRRGFPFEQKKFDEWLGWALERATDKKPGLEEAALMMLALPERPAPELVKLIAAEQQANGAWKPAGQFATMQKRGAADAESNSTRLCLIALATPLPAAPESEAARTKADTMLQRKDAATSMESLVFRTLYARRFGEAEEASARVKDILKQQRGDGGWSSFIGANMSDPLATGQVLHALQASETDPTVATAISRAQHWLLKMQQADGSWPTDITHVSKIDRSAPAKAKSFKEATAIYLYWGSAWATIGLLEGLAVKEAGAR